MRSENMTYEERCAEETSSIIGRTAARVSRATPEADWLKVKKMFWLLKENLMQVAFDYKDELADAENERDDIVNEGTNYQVEN